MTYKHTKGPWELNGKWVNGNHTPKGMSRKVGVVKFTCAPVSGEGLANARLIAAAPEMLEALDGFIRVLEMNCEKEGKNLRNADANKIDWVGFYEEGKAAIAKAKG